jgi:enoyl-CoA hydratase/carnithine racemase
MAEALLLRETNAGVAKLTMNRPDQFNSLSEELLAEFQQALDTIAADASVRVVVLAGAGKAFCAGHDLKQMRANHSKEYMQRLFRQCGRLMTTITGIPQPVVARVHGIATAAGCQLVASCDLAVAAEGARFAVSGINVGLFCSTPAVALSRNMGRKRRGLVNRVVPAEQLDAEVRKLTDSICAKSAAAVRLGKQLFYKQLEMGQEAAYQVASETMACNMMFEDAGEGIDAFMAKRKPEWRGR